MREKAAVMGFPGRCFGRPSTRGLTPRWLLLLCACVLTLPAQFCFAADTTKAMILYLPPAAWARYFNYIAAGLVVIIVQALLIVGLLWQRARNRESDLRLRESEARFRLMADTTPALIWMCDEHGTVTYLNDKRIDFTGRDAATGFGDTWSAFIHPEDIQSVQMANAQALEKQSEFSKEYRLRRRDGVYRWMLDVAAPRVDAYAHLPGLSGRRLTLPTRSWHRIRWKK